MPMILIIDNYFTPASKIRDLLYRNKRLMPYAGAEEENTVYFIHAECEPDLEKFIYQAEEVVEVRNGRLVAVNKKKRCVVYYEIRNGTFIKESRARTAESARDIESLPYIRAQKEGAVSFPSDEE